MEPMTIILCGDILPTRRLANSGPATRALYEMVRAADLAIGNFEMPLISDGAPVQKLLNIRADPEIAIDVPHLGFTVLTLANNHAVDYGWPGLEATARLLRKQGLAVVGVGCTRDEAASPSAIQVSRGRRHRAVRPGAHRTRQPLRRLRCKVRAKRVGLAMRQTPT
jgi:poly-gamma-glutamate synthesis protein (capsule biosynthesis protein)